MGSTVFSMSTSLNSQSHPSSTGYGTMATSSRDSKDSISKHPQDSHEGPHTHYDPEQPTLAHAEDGRDDRARLHRGLSSRQVSMIAIAGTIGQLSTERLS